MTLRLGDTAPDFETETTQGKIRFHDWTGDSWCILFSHPKDFTPVCTTELGYMAKLGPEFAKRNVKVIGLSVDRIDSHKGWVKDIEETQGSQLNYPIIADPDRKVANLYGMMVRRRRALYGPHRVRHRSQEEDPADDHLSADDRAELR
jgi:alkyl hydroperoxide reductase subunit AhpC